MKKYFKKILSILTIIMLLFLLTGCNNKENNGKLNGKVKEELLYLDLEIISLINALNNITIENYKISTEEISLR